MVEEVSFCLKWRAVPSLQLGLPNQVERLTEFFIPLSVALEVGVQRGARRATVRHRLAAQIRRLLLPPNQLPGPAEVRF